MPLRSLRTVRRTLLAAGIVWASLGLPGVPGNFAALPVSYAGPPGDPGRQARFVTLSPPDRSVIVLSRDRGLSPGEVRTDGLRRIVVNADVRFEPGTYEGLRIMVESGSFTIDGSGAVMACSKTRFFKGRRGPFLVTVLPAASVSVMNCEIAGYQVGVQLFSSTGSTIHGNLFRENFYAVVLRDSHRNRITGNRFVSQVLNDISLYGSGQNVIRENLHRETAHDAVNLLASSHENLVARNRFETIGAEVVGIIRSDRNRVQENFVHQGLKPILLMSAHENRVEHNRFSDCIETVSLEMFSSRNRISHNVFLGAERGMELEAGSGNLVLGNRLEGINGPGLTLRGFCRENVIAGNTILCSERALVIEDSFPLLPTQCKPRALGEIENSVDPSPRGNVFLGNLMARGDAEPIWGEDGRNSFESNRPIRDAEGAAAEIREPGEKGEDGEAWKSRNAGVSRALLKGLEGRAVELFNSYDARYGRAEARIGMHTLGEGLCFSLGEDTEGLRLLLWEAPMGTWRDSGNGVCFDPSGFFPAMVLFQDLSQRILLRLAGLPGDAAPRGPPALFRLLLYDDESIFPVTLVHDPLLP